MTTRLVRQEVVWAILGMEMALSLPILAMLTEGTGLARVASTVLLALLLPAGYVALRLYPPLRDPAWRILAGFALVVLLRLNTALQPGEGAAAAMARFIQALLPGVLLFALWWRGGALAESEFTASDVRVEFMLVGGGLLVLLVVFHGLLPANPDLLGVTVGLFAISGALATVFARQDAAAAPARGAGRLLAAGAALLPVGGTLLLVLLLQPTVLGTFWQGLARLLELVFTPLGVLLAWLASLLPQGRPVEPPAQPPPPARDDFEDLSAFLQDQSLPDWMAWAALILVFCLVVVLVVGLIRVLLDSDFLAQSADDRQADAATVEQVGDARGDVRLALGWLADWLRGLLPSTGSGSPNASGNTFDARAAYRSLLDWADQRGLGRSTAETTLQLQTRLDEQVPEAREVVDQLTSAYEQERYGERSTSPERLQRLRAALQGLLPAERR